MSKINEQIETNTIMYAKYYQDPKLKLIKLLEGYKFKSAMEIGCGAGKNFIELKKNNPECFTFGVDIRPDLRSELESNVSVDQFVIGDGLEILPKLDRKFDLIILSHVLEHFSNPEYLLKACMKNVSNDAIILIALPNIRHISVLLPLIFFDRFEYKSAGILDITHLRFYTKKSAKSFIENVGLHIVRCDPEINDGKSGFVNSLTFGLLSGFCAHAYNFLCKVKV